MAGKKEIDGTTVAVQLLIALILGATVGCLLFLPLMLLFLWLTGPAQTPDGHPVMATAQFLLALIAAVILGLSVMIISFRYMRRKK